MSSPVFPSQTPSPAPALLFLLSPPSSSAQDPPPSRPVLSLPANLPLVALVTIQRGFSPQPRRQGNTWLSSRPLLEVRGPPLPTLARMHVGSVGICSAAAGRSGRTETQSGGRGGAGSRPSDRLDRRGFAGYGGVTSHLFATTNSLCLSAAD